ANLGAAAGMIELAERLGVDPDAMMQVVLNGSSTSFAAHTLASARASNSAAATTLEYLRKDVQLLADIAQGSPSADGAEASANPIDIAMAGVAELLRRSGDGTTA